MIFWVRFYCVGFWVTLSPMVTVDAWGGQVRICKKTLEGKVWGGLFPLLFPSFTRWHHQSVISEWRAFARTGGIWQRRRGPLPLWVRAQPGLKPGPGRPSCPQIAADAFGAYLALDLPPFLFCELMATLLLQLLKNSSVCGQAVVDLCKKLFDVRVVWAQHSVTDFWELRGTPEEANLSAECESVGVGWREAPSWVLTTF